MDLVKGRSGENGLYLTLAFVAMRLWSNGVFQTRMNVLNDSILKMNNTDCCFNDSLRKGYLKCKILYILSKIPFI